MDRRSFLGTCVAVAWAGLAGCTGSQNTGDGSGDDEMDSGDGTTVSVVDNDFSPTELEVEADTTVTWENDGSAGHTITAASLTDDGTDWSFDSGRIEPGEATTYTFESAGAYEYACTIHGESTMCGVILVGGASHTARLPCAGGGGGY